MWTRGEKLALVGTVAGLTAAIGTVMVVPEFRALLGLPPITVGNERSVLPHTNQPLPSAPKESQPQSNSEKQMSAERLTQAKGKSQAAPAAAMATTPAEGVAASENSQPNSPVGPGICPTIPPMLAKDTRHWHDRAEYDLYDQIKKESDPKKVLALLHTWQQNYPTSDFELERQRLLQEIGEPPPPFLTRGVVRETEVVYPIGDDVSAPQVIDKVDPEYSAEARTAKHAGTVVIGLVVDSIGCVSQIRVIRSLGLGLDEKAIEAVSKWRFRPGLKNGKPVATSATIEVNFRLE